MLDGPYLRAQAKRCFDLSQHCFDLTVAEQLRLLGESFEARAREVEQSRPVREPVLDACEPTPTPWYDRLGARLRDLASRYDGWYTRAG
jgi:hypothetical protein